MAGYKGKRGDAYRVGVIAMGDCDGDRDGDWESMGINGDSDGDGDWVYTVEG